MRVGVSLDTRTPTNYLNLYGQNVTVAVIDTGVDTNHPDLQGRVTGTALVDNDGHGTHVAGIIAADGGKSDTVTNAMGSINPGTNGQYRGKAPQANLYSLNFNLSDFFLQENVAAKTNILISNNSWSYGNSLYDIAAASYDAAMS